MITRRVPMSILTTLLGGFASHIGDQLRESHTSGGRQTPLHPGDHYGRILAWAWETERPLAMLLLLDVLVALRTTPPGAAPPSPPYTLEDLLAGLRFALLNRFDDYDRLIAAARVDVPAMYGAPGI
jgi:hypothetical protein